MIRGKRRQKAVDRGFVLSDHADWTELQTAIRESGAETVHVTHGYIHELVRWLNEQGINSVPLETKYEGDDEHDEILKDEFIEEKDLELSEQKD